MQRPFDQKQKVVLSRASQVQRHLSDLITRLELKPGDRLSENQIASWLGVSRTPVRQALQRLEWEGLVQRLSTGGFEVAELTEQSVKEMCGLLEILDTYIFRRAASRLSDQDKADLENCVEVMQTAAKDGDNDIWTESDRIFHSILATAAANSIAAELSNQFRRRVQSFWLSSASRQKRLEACSQEHKEIAEAIKNEDLDVVDALVSEHISHMRSSLLQMLADASPFLRARR